MDPWSPEGKRERLQKLYQDWRDCTRCQLSDYRLVEEYDDRGERIEHNVCFGNGNPDADIMLIGEGPGETEDRTGNVFVGAAGKLLNAIIEAAGLERNDLFIVNLVMCRPPENRDPMKFERDACYPRLYEQIYVVDPMLIMPVGKAAMEALMGGQWKSIKACRGKIGYVTVPGKVEDSIRYPAMPILHPAFISREDKINRETNNWEQGGWAHKTMKDFVRARQRVEWLKNMYKPALRELRRKSK